MTRKPFDFDEFDALIEESLNRNRVAPDVPLICVDDDGNVRPETLPREIVVHELAPMSADDADFIYWGAWDA